MQMLQVAGSSLEKSLFAYRERIRDLDVPWNSSILYRRRQTRVNVPAQTTTFGYGLQHPAPYEYISAGCTLPEPATSRGLLTSDVYSLRHNRVGFINHSITPCCHQKKVFYEIFSLARPPYPARSAINRWILTQKRFSILVNYRRLAERTWLLH